jgi:hypothetical protein
MTGEPTHVLVPVGILEQAGHACDEAAEHLEERAVDHEAVDTDEARRFEEQAGDFEKLARQLYAAARGEQVEWMAGRPA